MPWPNRIGERRLQLRRGAHQLPLTELERRNAIHGLVRWLPWLVRDREPNRVVDGAPAASRSPGYPFALG